ncbi:aldehyde dehydrogenase X [Cordyceps militaris CM01]|uniref:aldehyde dehydrogenase (NAD(+)) n=1 Tax=Cordyceps militaris (strain CM01) TaxID=983644 RepID=G3J476_CORMM|nr:aldehyde dehydrogenase X [Cordyceps militaris CM01]EGX95798.1 aldehyde dehydrogenase X [Cordyceps militaris CM01]
MPPPFKTPAVTDLTKFWINGEYVEPLNKEVFTVRNPKNDQVVSRNVPIGGPQDVDNAVKHAEAAFQGDWSRFSSAQRGLCLSRLADIMDEHLEGLLRLDTMTGGNPVSLIPTREKNYIVNGLRYMSGWCDKFKGEYMPDDDGFVKLVRHEPLGVCAAICPFNSPIATAFHKIGPALVTGNVIIVKPSEKTPFGTLALGPLIAMAGIPSGVVQVISGHGTTGELLARHMRIRKISFTGSVATGKKIQVASAQSNLKRATLELGGKSPAVIFDDANLENALEWTVKAIMARSGQVCIAASRVYVQKSIAKEFIQRYQQKMLDAAKSMGDPEDPNVAYGPLVDKISFERVKGMLERAKDQAELVVGGGVIGNSGCFIEPTVFVNPKPGAEIVTDEVFGPVSVIDTFETEEEVLAKANDTEFGLMAGVFTRDITRALRVSSKFESGVVGINCVSYVRPTSIHGAKDGVDQHELYTQSLYVQNCQPTRGFQESGPALQAMVMRPTGGSAVQS